MKDFLKKSENFNKVEFWAATTLFVLVVFFFITDALDTMGNTNTAYLAPFRKAGVPFHFYENYFIPRIIRYVFLYLGFLLLSLAVIPQLIRKQALARNILLIIVLFVVGGLIFGITETYLKNYQLLNFSTEQEAYNSIFKKSFLFSFWLLLMVGFYTVIKYAGIYLLSNTEALQARYSFVTQGGIVAFVLWMVVLFLILVIGMGDSDSDELLAGWLFIVPFGIFLYWYSIHTLIPGALPKRRPFLLYLGKVLLILLLSFFPLSFLIMLFVRHEEAAFGIAMVNTFMQLLITVPLSWILYKRQLRGNEELYVLKKELGHTSASFDFLRSQINPHFLFNALNTIYGSAIQEKAERTSEGIERLGDMMRFMLQENMQEKISLAREIEYLNNYIGLQKLRTDPMPGITLQAEIEEPIAPVQIAPMLLIPFVENAFKHGISFREPSHIKITLEVREKTLYFDVYNSKHLRPENDPEKNKSGIGLSNVRQRLQLLYPDRHELIIRETGKEYFVHLTIQLS